jgi:hypothetical protein
LASAELKIEQRSAEVEELTTRREMLEKVRISQISRFGIVMEKVAAIQKSLEDIQKALAKITEMAREES